MLNRVVFFVILLCALVAPNQSDAQISLIVKGGLSSSDPASQDIDVYNNGLSQFKLGIEDIKYGYHVGAGLKFKLAWIVLQPEFLLNSSSVDYRISNTSLNSVLNETYMDLDVPILAGFQAGPLRFMGGPVGHYHLNSTTELNSLDGYKQIFSKLKYGYQVGLGLDIFKFILFDVRYEGNFSNFGDHINFRDKHYEFSNTPVRLLFSLGLKIF